AGAVKVSRTSLFWVPESKFQTIAARLFGATAVPGVPAAVASAQITYDDSPVEPPALCTTAQPIARPLESRTGAVDVRYEPAFVVVSPPPSAYFPVGYFAVPLHYAFVTRFA